MIFYLFPTDTIYDEVLQYLYIYRNAECKGFQILSFYDDEILIFLIRYGNVAHFT